MASLPVVNAVSMARGFPRLTGAQPWAAAWHPRRVDPLAIVGLKCDISRMVLLDAVRRKYTRIRVRIFLREKLKKNVQRFFSPHPPAKRKEVFFFSHTQNDFSGFQFTRFDPTDPGTGTSVGVYGRRYHFVARAVVSLESGSCTEDPRVDFRRMMNR